MEEKREGGKEARKKGKKERRFPKPGLGRREVVFESRPGWFQRPDYSRENMQIPLRVETLLLHSCGFVLELGTLSFSNQQVLINGPEAFTGQGWWVWCSGMPMVPRAYGALHVVVGAPHVLVA